MMLSLLDASSAGLHPVPSLSGAQISLRVARSPGSNHPWSFHLQATVARYPTPLVQREMPFRFAACPATQRLEPCWH